ncbi:MAG: hypothetical protein HRF50_08650 [Phycisphaerae bacterium]|jgi:hypothetical protein
MIQAAVRRAFAQVILAVLVGAVTGCEKTPTGGSAPAGKSGSSGPSIPSALPKAATRPAAPPDVLIDLEPGELDGRTFRHKKLGLEMTFPEGWTVTLGVRDPKIPRALPLVLASERPPGTPGLFNRSVTLNVVTLKELPAAPSAPSYIEGLRNSLPLTGMQYSFDKVEPEHKLGEYVFAAVPARLTINRNVVMQRYLARRVGDYMVEICASFENRAAYDELKKQVLDTLKLGAP